MSTRGELERSLKDAMRTGDDLRKRTLRMALAAIKQLEIEKREPPDESAVIAILQKEIKSRQESIEDARRAGRPDLELASQAEAAVLETFLPQPLSDEELEVLARQAIAETGATSMREMGQVMRILVPRLEGRATGEQASQMVRRLLQS